MFGNAAEFRDGQLDAIESAVTNHFTLVVQKTGWGKSLVYFMATRYFRDNNYGPTIIVSPLLSLMRNQKDSAAKLSLIAEMVNYETAKIDIGFNILREKLKNNAIDILFITPEQLSKDYVKEILVSCINQEMALFVIDEVHCVSEWGHDFRPNFLDIKDFVNSYLVVNNRIHILATTATANDFVIDDLKEQFNCDMNVLRGPLLRESLRIQVLDRMDLSHRYAWILNYLRKNNGSGIIYCLTINDCEQLALFLRCNGANAHAYHGSLNSSDREMLENYFYDNRIKVLVATTALGMGYDKSDVSFVIHMQSPKSILEYYQQIGRAGRDLENADAILMRGETDSNTLNFFIRNALPAANLMRDVLDRIDSQSKVTENQLLSEINIKAPELRKILKHLFVRKLIAKDGSYYTRTLLPDNLDEYISTKARINERRHEELTVMDDYFRCKSCYMEFISQHLNDPYQRKCGKCSNCTDDRFSENVSDELVNLAVTFIKTPYRIDHTLNIIHPRKQFFCAEGRRNIPEVYQNMSGYFLTRYNTNTGHKISENKYKSGAFSHELVVLMKNMIDYLFEQQLVKKADAVVYVPSLNRPDLVRNFAYELSSELGVKCYDAIIKTIQTPEQKTMENSVMQFNNVFKAFSVNDKLTSELTGKNVYLVDDMCDSRWTLTVCGFILHKSLHVGSVTPFVLADTSNIGGDS